MNEILQLAGILLLLLASWRQKVVGVHPGWLGLALIALSIPF